VKFLSANAGEPIANLAFTVEIAPLMLGGLNAA
jgi:hypothetical protein